MSLINSIKAFITYLIIITSAWSIVLFAVTPAVPLIFFNRRFYLRWCSTVNGYFLLMITCLLEDLLGIKIVITGDDLTKDKKRSMILLNHRTRIDWSYIWMLQSRFQILKHLKIVLKAQLKHIPGIGWGMQHAGYLFLERHWEEDKPQIKKVIHYYKSSQFPISLLIFPEGTNLSAETKARSNTYAAKQPTYNRPYEYCLHPRTTGFVYLLNLMRADEIIDTIDDITVGYEGKFPVTEIDLLKGHVPTVVHFHVKRYNINEIPLEDEEAAKWLRQLWDEKENRLQKFYQNFQFDSPSTQCNNSQQESSIRLQRRLALLFWLLFILFWASCFLMFIKIKFYVLLVCLFHLVMEVFAHGLIDFICQLNSNSRQQHLQRSAIKND